MFLLVCMITGKTCSVSLTSRIHASGRGTVNSPQGQRHRRRDSQRRLTSARHIGERNDLTKDAHCEPMPSPRLTTRESHQSIAVLASTVLP